MADAVMRCLHTSKIPHLGVSLLAKRAGRPSNLPGRQLFVHCTCQIRKRALTTAITPSSLHHSKHSSRTYASTAPTLPRPPPRASRVPPPPPPIGIAARQPKTSNSNSNNGLPRTRTPDRASSGRSFQIYFWGVSLFGFVLSAYLSSLYVTYKREVRESAMLDLAPNADVSSRWLDLSRNFDDEVDMSEKLMSLRAKRRNLCQQAQGNVLEVSAGTGRNMDLYNLDPINTPRNRRIKSLVFNDQSEIMVYQAQKRFESLQEETDAIAKFRGPVRFIVGDAGDKRIINRPEGGFDTIIQTMGLCSMSSPVGFLRRLGELCRQPGERSTGLDVNLVRADSQEKRNDSGASAEAHETAAGDELDSDKGGKILLLEHGRSNVGFINKYLDNIAKRHADRYGCWWNKDIEQIVLDSGLVVESKKRYHFGTTYEYVLRPRGGLEKDASERKPS
ncbi:hypothetical protein A1O3_06711 [Capronia epimyces CBS 606.96]|uniref:Uncharacterized protein n=1 Tax=Capronia epimyces CBS 606.96 TaxID=1182542 RepID=W9XZW8_9EURO|nr:uncharacterized protein A1O3_06711 [Capronia epimyces CBS 606.96]EXJ82895.1 hypothetical protein A1O3_06711 [Capronia epimyces CBS 606.96]